ncbi:hypothetical protein COY28_02675 [Candidatus Woesearchaeota archaeon CG_4_10_14_0_2_um_filter_57_5]|nr:MAG: hypothetical protein COV94_04925 [Candidatus Woesearchaeota archaeon CG11_big_fil_rev_8_21_14_0_20_57_5]PIZ54431.1 MAG: hypothetical protein COY28_02675 [Candidatus Woesearchaeota archaeon CG_4_10_14_0_2_um_filter_57_5]
MEARRNILDDFCHRFCCIAEKHCQYIVVSGFVAISSGRVRGTEDIDLILERLDSNRFGALHQDLLDEGFRCLQSDDEDEILSYLQGNIPVRYVMEGSMLPQMEVKFAKDALDEYQLQTRVKLPKTGIDVWFSSIPMNIAFKEILLKSDKDIKDAEHLRNAYPELIDEQELQKIGALIRRYRL